MNNILNITNRADFREWLAANSATEKECWIAARRGQDAAGGRPVAFRCRRKSPIPYSHTLLTYKHLPDIAWVAMGIAKPSGNKPWKRQARPPYGTGEASAAFAPSTFQADKQQGQNTLNLQQIQNISPQKMHISTQNA